MVGGLLLDHWLGDPEGWPHPVRGFGFLADLLERLLNRGPQQFWAGLGATLLLVGGVIASMAFVEHGVRSLSSDLCLWLLTVVGVYFGVAYRSLLTEVEQVFARLANEGLDAGRAQVSRIVGRDPALLDKQGVKRAALESLAENLSDGVVAPLFYFSLFGLPGLWGYKMVNTLDSMWGYRSDRFEAFGKSAARLDDLLNWIPARLTAALIALCGRRAEAFRVAFAQGGRHPSPNAGYPEAALAGVLGCRFGGPSFYQGSWVDKPFIGVCPRTLEENDLHRAVLVCRRAAGASFVLLGSICLCS